MAPRNPLFFLVKDRWVWRGLFWLNEDAPAASMTPGSLWGRLLVPSVSPWGCDCLAVTVNCRNWSRLCSIMSDVFVSKANSTAQEHPSRRNLKRRGWHSECLHSAIDSFQTSSTHYMAGSEDMLITENSPIFRMLLLASLFVEISGQDTICYQKISFHQICPH